ncbi:MAG TPA: sialidase family protein, partial [Patescibacteria group bacterium]|nr:sialidase family protein [Patescibacteria group bacterium]
ASPTAPAPTAPAPTASQPSPSASTAAPVSFTWAARPDAFPGEDGASLTSVAAGPAGLLAVSARDGGEGSPTRRLWRSADGLTWQLTRTTGLPDRVYISGLWGAGGQYWIRGHLPDSDDPGILYRSADGLAWRFSRNLSSSIQTTSIADGCSASMSGARDACPVFITGSRGVDGAIWRSADGGASWARASVADATGWKGTQDAAPVEILGIVATSDGLLAYGNGLAKASDTSGYLQARFWRSADDGQTWTRVPNVALFGELYVHDVVVAGSGDVIAVGDRVDESVAVALRSVDGGRTWARSVTAGDREHGGLAQVVVAADGLVGLGFANPAGVDTFPVREFVWSSGDGGSWVTIPAGDLEGGVVDDAARFGDRIVAVGRGWTTATTGTWEAPFGPAVWTLEP